MYASALDFAGLYTFPNPLAKVPVGAALTADNLVANKDGTAECRRGLAAQGTSLSLAAGQYITQWFAYQNRLLIHDTVGGLWYDSDGSLTWTQFSGSYAVPSGATKIRGVEANKNFYLATAAGIEKLSSYSTTPTLAGCPPGLDGTGALAGAGSGFLASNFQCAYQIVFGYTDANGNLILSAPSERILVVNSTGGSDDVTLTFTVPQGLTTSHFYQIYRTTQTAYSAVPASNVPPGAEPLLSAQQTLTAGEIAALTVNYTDVTTDALLGAALYTNPSQQGALQPNDQPPLCADMCLFSQMMFYANCSTLQNMTFNLISVGAPNGVQNGDTIIVNGITFTGAGAQNNAVQQFKVDTSGTVSQNIDNTARNLIQCINANAATTNVYAIYLSGYNQLPGLIELRAVGFSISTFYVTSSRGGAFSPTLPSSGTTFASSNDQTPNGIYVSKIGQPEAVPAVNLIFVGGGDQSIYRILPLRDRVVVLKSDGIYIITGSTPSSLSITLLDSTVTCISQESARLLNNSVYCMTNQGVVSITESGVTIQSRSIEQDLLQLTGPSFTSFTASCHGIAYESERLFILAMPTDATDTYGTQAWCYNWVTNAWTRWPIDVSSGIVNPFDNRLYMGRPATNNSYAYQERKNYANSDFMDDQIAVTITAVSASGLVITLNTAPSDSWVGYGLDQTVGEVQYIAKITAVDIGAMQVTVDLDDSTTPGTVIPWLSSSAAAIDVPITVAYVGAPITAGFPHYVKDWQRANFWFNGGNFQKITLGFISDIQGQIPYTQITASTLSSSGYGFGPFGGGPYGGAYNYPQCIQTLVPTAAAKARWVQPTVDLSFPGARLSFLGTTISYEIVSDVTG